MKHMNPINQSTPTPVHENTCRDGIDINKYTISLSNPSNPHPTTDTIAFPSSFPPILSTTTFDNQTTTSYSSSSFNPLLSLYPILKTFLSSDISTTIPKLNKFRKGHSNSRIICSGGSYHLIVSYIGSGNEGKGKGCEEEKWDIFKLCKNRGGIDKDPIHCDTLTSSQIQKLEEMLKCRNVTGSGHFYCQVCPRCLSFKGDGKTFVYKPSEIRRQQNIIYDLEEWERDNGYLSELRNEHDRLEKLGYKHDASVLRNRIKRLEDGISDPQKNIFYAELYLEELQQEAKILKDSAKLSDESHFFLSICTPSPLNVLYNAVDEWFEQRVPTPSRRTSPAIRRILKGLKGKEMGFSAMLRAVFSQLVKEAVKEMNPGVVLTYRRQTHPFNRYGLSPDIHFLVRKTVLKAGVIKELNFVAEDLRKAVEDKMQIFMEFVSLLIRELNKFKTRSFKSSNTKWSDTTFRNWRKAVEKAEKIITEFGISAKVVDIELREQQDLLGTHVYLRKYPYEYIHSISFEKGKGKVNIKYWERNGVNPKPAVVGLIDFLFRLVSIDMRRCRVQSIGDYLTTKSETRDEKMEANKVAREKSTDKTESMRQEMRDRHATIDGGSSGKTSEM